ncbi:PRD domain-containing protein [Demequina mangrovi]|uniref:Transcriptional antiterminator, BglG family n=1 Tax=Demequina mangrovi TaxID=1043493 RepID=A0A1H6UI95_9MICO|nr:PRD domain-containing protein [Demequina mangrovi]SEI87875.1 transcriptional antiterminator, BglG family [Demequina mangrovi]
MRIAKVFNNSVVLGVDDAGCELVVFGRGVGFQASRGDMVDESLIERRFVPSEAAPPERIAALIDEIPAADIDLTARIVEDARRELGAHVTDHVLVPLADHISFALRRAAEGAGLTDYPLKWEVMSLYPSEVAFARRALATVERDRGVVLPEIEAVPLALHFVNAQLGARDIQATVDMTTMLAQILEIIRDEYGEGVDEDENAVARFVTHLRYLYARGRSGVHRDDETPELARAIETTQPREYAVAQRLAAHIGARYGWEVRTGEVLYLAIHVIRLTTSIRAVAGCRGR